MHLIYYIIYHLVGDLSREVVLIFNINTHPRVKNTQDGQKDSLKILIIITPKDADDDNY